MSKSIFVVGCPRSGTSLLREKLNNHEKIAIMGETHYFTHMRLQLLSYYFTKNPYFFYNLTYSYLYRLLKSMNIDDYIITRKLDIIDIANLLRNYHYKQYRWFDNSNLSIKDIINQIDKKNSISNYNKIFKAWIEAYAINQNKPICGEKTPIHILYIDEIQKIFDNSYFLHIIRNPFSTVASIRKMPWGSNDLITNSKLWCKCMDIDTSSIKNYYQIKFEDLIDKPEFTMKNIINFLGVRFNKDILNKSNSIIESNEYWKKDSIKLIDKKRIRTSSEELNQDEKILIRNFIVNYSKNKFHIPYNI